MLQKNQIIELIENTGMYFYDEELTNNARANKDGIKFIKFELKEEFLHFNELFNLLVPLSISISNISEILNKIYKVYYIQEGKEILQNEMRELLGIN